MLANLFPKTPTIYCHVSSKTDTYSTFNTVMLNVLSCYIRLFIRIQKDIQCMPLIYDLTLNNGK